MVLANVATKVLGFAAVAYVTRHTTEQDFGLFSYAKNAVGALVPLMGFGAYQAFLRYSADAPSQRSKKSLYFYALGRGIVFSLALVAVLHGLAPWICNAIPDSVNVFVECPSAHDERRHVVSLKGVYNGHRYRKMVQPCQGFWNY